MEGAGRRESFSQPVVVERKPVGVGEKREREGGKQRERERERERETNGSVTQRPFLAWEPT